MGARWLYIIPGETVTFEDDHSFDGKWFYQPHNEIGPYDAVGPYDSVNEAIKDGREDVENSMNWSRDSYELSVDE